MKTSEKVVLYLTLATSHEHFKLTLHTWSVLSLRKYDLFLSWIPLSSTYTRGGRSGRNERGWGLVNEFDIGRLFDGKSFKFEGV
ncbi:hypothetical protein TorRG33x02_144320 [Trema orientale]|uniref:Uncharacterized protein n=1 Tax=Trema orientale TaxID=63057 RepID=A0A2P5EW34_TREOI|nr:hypothetical protein TorRG33x02_144320 [Trema orientale]